MPKILSLTPFSRWHQQHHEDFAFSTATTGKPVIMGRKTWESLPRSRWPGRQNIVITPPRLSGRQAQTAAFEDALALCQWKKSSSWRRANHAQALADCHRFVFRRSRFDVDGDAFSWLFHRNMARSLRENHVSAKGIEYAFVHYVKAYPIEAV